MDSLLKDEQFWFATRWGWWAPMFHKSQEVQVDQVDLNGLLPLVGWGKRDFQKLLSYALKAGFHQLPRFIHKKGDKLHQPKSRGNLHIIFGYPFFRWGWTSSKKIREWFLRAFEVPILRGSNEIWGISLVIVHEVWVGIIMTPVWEKLENCWVYKTLYGKKLLTFWYLGWCHPLFPTYPTSY